MPREQSQLFSGDGSLQIERERKDRFMPPWLSSTLFLPSSSAGGIYMSLGSVMDHPFSACKVPPTPRTMVQTRREIPSSLALSVAPQGFGTVSVPHYHQATLQPAPLQLAAVGSVYGIATRTGLQTSHTNDDVGVGQNVGGVGGARRLAREIEVMIRYS
eukprot:scpid94292/ scgid33617/ 